MATSTLRAPAPPRITAPAAQSVAPARSTSITSLDGLRGLAILLVVWTHFDEFLRGPAGSSQLSIVINYVSLNAAAGVELFFVLSGFLLFLPYARALVTPELATWPRARIFYLRRLKRIYPAYLTLFLGIAGLMLTVLAQRYTLALALAHFPWGQMLAGLLLLFDFHRSTFDLMAGVNPILGYITAPLWSLAVEWQFYLLLPLIAWGIARLGTLRRRILALVLLLIVGLAIRGLAAWTHYALSITDPADASGLLGLVCSFFYGVHGKYLEVFALGMLASLLYVWGIEQQHWTRTQQRTLAFVLLLLCGIGSVGCSLWATFGAGRYEGRDTFFWPSAVRHGIWAISYSVAGDWTFGLCASALLLSVLCLPRSWGAVFRFRPLTLVGLISFSLYLWHWPLAFLTIHSGSPIPSVVVLCLIIAWSAGLYYTVERPFLRHRLRTDER